MINSICIICIIICLHNSIPLRNLARQIQKKRKASLGVPEIPRQINTLIVIIVIIVITIIIILKVFFLINIFIIRNWADMNVPDKFKVTFDGEQFNILDEYVLGTTKKVWGFVSESGLQGMKNLTVNDLYGDGTFELVKQSLFPQVCYQLYNCWPYYYHGYYLYNYH